MKTNKFSIILSDPCWQYSTKECLAKTSILNGDTNTHYPTMSLEDLKRLDVLSICEKDCLLFLWVVSPMLPEALELISAWGFKYCTVAFVWHKQRINPGHYTLSECELCLVAKRGKIPTPRGARNIRQFLSEMRTKHSAKPKEIRDRITQMFPTQSKIELFAREKVEGWSAWGNEVESDVTIELV